jgi:hypothetical protein
MVDETEETPVDRSNRPAQDSDAEVFFQIEWLFNSNS